MYSCKHGCGYEHSHKGAMNLHERIHCKTLKKEVEVENVSRETKEKKERKKSGCVHSWRLLSSQHQNEAMAIQAGYREVCRTCQMVQ